MKKYFLFVIFMLIINSAFARDSTKTKQCELKHGLQFQIRSLLQLANFDGYTFSYRYLFDKNSGIRIGLLFDLNKDDNNITQRVDTLSINPPGYDHYYNFKISAQYLHTLIQYKKFSFILGGGPFISYSKSEIVDESLYSDYTLNYYSKDESFGFGLDMIFGVEYKPIDNIVFSGEYGLSLSKVNSKIDDKRTYNNMRPVSTYIYRINGKTDSFSISSSGVNLGIAVFF